MKNKDIRMALAVMAVSFSIAQVYISGGITSTIPILVIYGAVIYMYRGDDK